MRCKLFRALFLCVALVSALTIAPNADTTAQSLPFSQNWTNIGLIATDDVWTAVPGIIGYRGDGMASAGAGVDPRTILADAGPSGPVVDVNANQTNPNTFTTGGVAEFHIADPVIALQGSGTARAPHIVISISTVGQSTIQIAYNLRDIDGSADNAVQPVALQYRIGGSGSYTNLPAGFVADASTGPSLAAQVTPVAVNLPSAVDNQALVQLRIITTDAVGSDEWIGIDDINITGSAIPQPTNPTGIGAATPSTVATGGSTLLTVAVTPGANPPSTGLGVVADLTPIGGNATQTFFDDGAHGDGLPGDNTFGFLATVPANIPGGVKSITATVSDSLQPVARSSTTTFTITVQAPAPKGVVISQVYGGGGNSGAPFTNDYIELYNTTAAAVNLSGWSVQYASAGGSSWQVTPLGGTIAANGYYLVQEAAGATASGALPAPDATGTIPMAAGAGKVALANTTAAFTGCPTANPAVADFVGYGSAANCAEGSAVTATLSNTTAALRNGAGAIDTDDNAADFTVAAPNPRNHAGNRPAGAGSAVPQAVPANDITQTLLTLAVTPGTHPVNTDIAVTADLTPIGGTAGTTLYDDGSHGDAVAHDLVFSRLTAVSTSTSFGVKTLQATITDTVPRTAAATIRLAVETTSTAIHEIQGPGSVSPHNGEFVTTRGIVTALKFNGVFVQTRDGEADSDDLTSEGLFVFTSAAPPGFLSVGQDVLVTGTVQEFVPGADPDSPPTTELINAYFRAVASGQPLPVPTDLLPSYTNPGGNFEQLERFEGMRIRANIQAIAPTQDAFVDEVNARSTSNGIFYAVIQGVARPMREPGLEPTQVLPDGAPSTVPRFDGNPERLRIDSDALLGAPKIEIAAGQTIPGFTGVLDYAFRSYMILPDPADAYGLPWQPAGDGAAVPVPIASETEFTIGHFNLERLFDDVDDPAFPPNNEPVVTTSALNDRLAKMSLAIRHVLRTPDILGVVEVENLAVLQRLAARISADAVAAAEPDPQYAAYLEAGNDVGSIDVGLLVKRAGNRVTVLSVTQVGKDATYTTPTGGTALLNDRPSLVLEAEIAGPGAGPSGVYPVTAIVNHLRSLSGIDGSDGERIRAKRRAQAEFLANYIQSRQAANPAERIVSVGDYNAFQFSDGYVDVMHTIEGTPTPADQVVLASPDLVDPNLTNVVDLLPAVQRYSFSFDGNAQAIDHVLVNDPMRRRFSRMAYARLDADFPESFRNDPTRPERISDHDAPVAYFAFPQAPVVTMIGDNPLHVEAFTGTLVDPGATAIDVGATVDQDRPLPVSVSSAVDAMVPGSYTVTYSATNGFFTTSADRTVIVSDTTAPSIQGFSVTPVSIWPPNHKMVGVVLSYVSTDASGGAVCLPEVTSSEAPNGRGDGNTAVDTEVIDATHVRVRSERSGQTRTRVYTITLSCADASGNRWSAVARVTVQK